MAIRYDKKINKEIYKTVYDYNRKIKQLEGMEGIILPSKITTKELKQSVYNRRELRAELKNLKRFLKPGAEDIVSLPSGITSRYDLEVLKATRRSAIARINAKIQKLYNTELSIFAAPTKNTYATMGDQRYINLQSKRKYLSQDYTKLNQEEFIKYVKLVNRNFYSDKNREWKESYLELLTKEGYELGVNPEIIKEIEIKMMKLKPDEFVNVYNKELGIQTVTEYYKMMMDSIKNGQSVDYLKDNVTQLYENLNEKLDLILEKKK